MVNELELSKLFNGIYKNRRVFITGHTGFKGSWLALWLTNMGAVVKGFSLAANTKPSHWELLNLQIESIIGDIRDRKLLYNEINSFNPEIVFHLAAQPLVRLSYVDPILTYETNVIGTLNVLEACRQNKNIKAVVTITSDKCYENQEWIYGYRETDPMGGFDPYSSSKGCVEILSASYRNSYWNIKDYKNKHNTLLATARAGNVIGGGDWAEDRLVPDIMKAAAINGKVHIRNPNSVRPWQHVLEPLSGYLMLGQKLYEEEKEFAEAWNFGPAIEGTMNVIEVCQLLKKHWENVAIELDSNTNHPHEANLLSLDCSKSQRKLKWEPVWGNTDTFSQTAIWYKDFYSINKLNSNLNLQYYIIKAKEKSLKWTI